MQQANHNVSTLSSAVVMKEMNSGGAEVNNRRQSWAKKKLFLRHKHFLIKADKRGPNETMSPPPDPL